jgi:hypothetical protein
MRTFLCLATLLAACAQGTSLDWEPDEPAPLDPEDAGLLPDADRTQEEEAAPSPPRDAGPATVDARVEDAGARDAGMPTVRGPDLVADFIDLVQGLAGVGNDGGTAHCEQVSCITVLDCQLGLSVLDCGFARCETGVCRK